MPSFRSTTGDERTNEAEAGREEAEAGSEEAELRRGYFAQRFTEGRGKRS